MYRSNVGTFPLLYNDLLLLSSYIYYWDQRNKIDLRSVRFVAKWPVAKGKRGGTSPELSQWKTSCLRESNADDDLGAIQGVVADSYNRIYHVCYWNVSSILERGLWMVLLLLLIFDWASIISLSFCVLSGKSCESGTFLRWGSAECNYTSQFDDAVSWIWRSFDTSFRRLDGLWTTDWARLRNCHVKRKTEAEGTDVSVGWNRGRTEVAITWCTIKIYSYRLKGNIFFNLNFIIEFFMLNKYLIAF